MAQKKPQKPAGVSPKVLLDQVKSTAAWAFDVDPPLPAATILAKAPALEKAWKTNGGGEEYFVTLLAAHFITVGTFCPTDVDARIRQHAWSTLERDRLASAVTRVEEVSRWPVAPVTARHVVVGDEVLSGHQGEWFSVMAGALGRALVLSDQKVIDRTRDWIETELTREAKLVTQARQNGSDHDLLAIATTVAHNLGDLSRVVDTWKPAHAESEIGTRYRRLGHEDGARFDGAFVFAGELNKKLMALENHRFLPLRVPKALRRARAFLLPFGPYFYEWGSLLGSTKLLSDEERVEILLALARVHEGRKEELGCLRAIAGMNDAYPGGIDKLARIVPAERRSALALGGIRLALRVSEKDFLKSFHAGVER